MQRNNFKGYTLLFSSQANKDLKNIDSSEAKKIDKKLRELIAGNENLDIKKMQGTSEAEYRLRCGDYRILFEIKREVITILVIRVSHRREAYRDY